MLKRIIPLLAVLAAVFWSRSAEASHFRYGTIAWTVPNPQTAPLTVKFTVTVAWKSTNIGNTTLDFGDGANNGIATGLPIGTGTDTLANAYTVQQYTATHSYAAAGTYIAFFQSSARILSLENGALSSYRVDTKVGIAAGNTGGPVSAAPAILQMQVGNIRTYTFPAYDPDGSAITCRFGTSAEMWSSNTAVDGFPPAASNNIPVEAVGNKAPTLTSTAAGCVLTWDLTKGLPGKQYALHIMFESTPNGLTSSTAIDLIVETVTPPPPTCAGSGTFIANVGQVFTTSTTGAMIGAGTLLFNATNVPNGAVINPASGNSAASPFTNTLTWTPTAAFSGTTQIVLMNYTNSTNITGTCFLTIQIPQCPNFGAACGVGVGECNRTGTNVCAGPGITVCSVTAGSPTAEVCDGKDNDCNGVVDNGSPGSGVSCSSGLPGVCGPGITACTGGALVCNPNITPGTQSEICDGQDNNCDGTTDNGNPGGGLSCNSGLQGVCAAGTTLCTEGVIFCEANVAPGTQAEVCDGKDNNCDGIVDNNNPGGGVACTSSFPGVCSAGTTACTAGTLVCNANIAPGSQTEVCDGKDNNCDGVVDNGNPGGGIACASGLPGVCAAGTTACIAGAVACNPNVSPGTQAEVCDGKDNNCDGVVDNNNPGGGLACASGLPGVCAAGTTACTAGAIACNANIAPGAQQETCDGKDNNCDGVVDNGNPGGGLACNSGLPGVCAAGTTACTAGAIACDANITPGAQSEICDGKDNNCDGVVDNGNPGGGLACNSGLPGECAAGTTACTAGAIACNANITPGSQSETCDGKDNNCDGVVDDNNPGGGLVCNSGLPGVCSAGTTACTAGAIACNANITPGSQSEICDGKDNNCDGVIDDNNPGGGLVCVSGLPGDCSAGTTACTAGAVACNANITPGSQQESCDNKDNDCDGAIDNGNPGGGVVCVSGLPGVCSVGTTACTLGALACNANIKPGTQPETCDTKDNDCNGTVDDGFVLGAVCSVGVGTCAATGVIACDATGGTACNAVPGAPVPEVCSDFLDNDCDGTVNNGCLDSDGDGLYDDYEVLIGTNPFDADSDDDGVPDGKEPDLAEDTDGDGLINALDADSDNDGLFDGTELGKDCSNPATDLTKKHCVPDADMGATVTDPLDPDTDDGGVSDGSEDTNLNGKIDPGETDPTTGHGADDPLNLDSDGDGLSDVLEISIGTDPHDADSDDDGVPDGQEPNLTDDTDGDGLINALDPDSDGDGIFDGTELGKDCSEKATDVAKMHCIPDADMGATTTNPLDHDTDHGGVSDGVEDANHNGQIDAGELDPNDPIDDTGCTADIQCGAANSGMVCDGATHACTDGCRGMGGNGCPDGKVCTSKTEVIGTCTDGAGGAGGGTSSASTTGSTSSAGGAGGGSTGEGGAGGSGGSAPQRLVPSGNGIFCSATPGSGDDEGASWLLGGALAMLVNARRRRRAA
jgi:Bacterial TSP3 repeat/Putative metal-binding motif